MLMQVIQQCRMRINKSFGHFVRNVGSGRTRLKSWIARIPPGRLNCSLSARQVLIKTEKCVDPLAHTLASWIRLLKLESHQGVFLPADLSFYGYGRLLGQCE